MVNPALSTKQAWCPRMRWEGKTPSVSKDLNEWDLDISPADTLAVDKPGSRRLAAATMADMLSGI